MACLNSSATERSSRQGVSVQGASKPIASDANRAFTRFSITAAYSSLPYGYTSESALPPVDIQQALQSLDQQLHLPANPVE